jgi:NAD+ diphosphatase
MVAQFQPGLHPPADSGDAPGWLLFQERRLLLGPDGSPLQPDPASASLPPMAAEYLGTLDGRPCYTATLDAATTLPAGWTAISLRAGYSQFPAEIAALAGRAIQVLEWDGNHRYCGRCGTATERVATERARRCPACGLVHYPRLSPAVIVLVHDGPAMLLARSSHSPVPFYSTLAGFVEPGETLEEAVAREVGEEVGIRVRDLRYFASQPWPFPGSLMIGFTAAYAGGAIQVDGEEITHADWFTAETLPQVSPPFSIARWLINAHLAAHAGAGPR